MTLILVLLIATYNSHLPKDVTLQFRGLLWELWGSWQILSTSRSRERQLKMEISCYSSHVLQFRQNVLVRSFHTNADYWIRLLLKLLLTRLNVPITFRYAVDSSMLQEAT